MSANTTDQTVQSSNEVSEASQVRVEDILSIRDPNIDVERIMREIRRSIELRRAEAEAKGLNFDQLALGRYQIPTGERFPHRMYETLYQANVLRDKALVSPVITSRQTPIIGPLIQKIRGALHQLVIFYVNMSAARQIESNVETTKALNQLVDALDREGNTPAQVQELRERLQQLEERLAVLETRSRLDGANDANGADGARRGIDEK